MPTIARSHNSCRAIICAACGCRDEKCIDLTRNESAKYLALLKTYANDSYESSVLKNPAGLCFSCKGNDITNQSILSIYIMLYLCT